MGVALGLVLVGCTSPPPPAEVPPEQHPQYHLLVQLLGDEEAVETVRHPTRVIASVLDVRNVPKEDRDAAAYRRVVGPVKLSDELAREIGQLLGDPANYLWEVHKDCRGPMGYRLVFERAREGQSPHMVDMAYETHCEIVNILDHHDRVTRHEDFDEGHPAFAKLLMRIDRELGLVPEAPAD